MSTAEDKAWFRVEISDHAGPIVAMEPGMLAGRDIGETEDAKIREAIEHLQGFVGQERSNGSTYDHLMAKLRHCMKAVDAGRNYGFGQDIWRKVINRLEQLQMPHTEVIRLAGTDAGADVQAMLKALCAKVEAQRREIDRLLALKVNAEEAIAARDSKIVALERGSQPPAVTRPNLLRDETGQWEIQTTDIDGNPVVTCHTRIVGGVLCRWWGDEAPPSGVTQINRAAAETNAPLSTGDSNA